MITITSCATSANLGPGFDCLGLAMELCNTWRLQRSESWMFHSKPLNPQSHLLTKSLLETLEFLGKRIDGLQIWEDETNIPQARGLGSSAACIVAGIAAAYALTETAFDHPQILHLAAQMEGHGDNAAPAVYGGGMIAYKREERFMAEPFEINVALSFAAMIPPFELLTREARGVLPKSVALSDASFNLANSALCVRALEKGDTELLQWAMEDRLHQPYRLSLIPGAQEIFRFCKSRGAAAYLSGAGPTIMAVGRDGELVERLKEQFPRWQVERLRVRKTGFQCKDDGK